MLLAMSIPLLNIVSIFDGYNVTKLKLSNVGFLNMAKSSLYVTSLHSH